MMSSHHLEEFPTGTSGPLMYLEAVLGLFPNSVSKLSRTEGKDLQCSESQLKLKLKPNINSQTAVEQESRDQLERGQLSGGTGVHNAN